MGSDFGVFMYQIPPTTARTTTIAIRMPATSGLIWLLEVPAIIFLRLGMRYPALGAVRTPLSHGWIASPPDSVRRKGAPLPFLDGETAYSDPGA
jgi:hypothetical protein